MLEVLPQLMDWLWVCVMASKYFCLEEAAGCA